VIAGNAEAIDRACEIAKTRGAKRAIKLNVSAPFHCALMMPAQERLEKVLRETEFCDLKIPIVENVSGELNSRGERAREALIDQVSKPVRWVKSVDCLIGKGVSTFVEVGPGKVLSGLVKQVSRDVRCLNVETVAGLRDTHKNFYDSVSSSGAS
jgi:[acyl-carrier-protein] S-malonyltransferase